MASKSRRSHRGAPVPPLSKFYGGTVNVTIKEGAGLLPKDRTFFNKKGKSDPFVRIMSDFNDGRKKRTTELAKTATKKRTLSPIWDETFTLKLTSHHIPNLTFRIYDHDFGSACDEMGQVVINLLTDLEANTVVEKWYPVKVSPECEDATGSLQISLSYTLDPPPKTLGVPDTKATKDFLGGKAELTIVKADGLKPMDSSTFGKASSDPYCKIFLRDEATMKKSEVGKTKVMKKKLNPKWNANFAFLLTKEMSPVIIVEIFDHDMLSGDDPMGKLTIPVESFTKNKDEPSTYAVQPMEGCEGATGTLTFRLFFKANPPDPHKGKPFPGGLLLGTVVRAQNLTAVDKNLFGKKSSDPFVKVSTTFMSSSGKMKEEVLHSTKHKSGNLSPKFEERFCFDLSPFHDPLIDFSIFDYDKMSSPDPMGHVQVSMFDMIVVDDDTKKPMRYDSSGGNIVSVFTWP